MTERKEEHEEEQNDVWFYANGGKEFDTRNTVEHIDIKLPTPGKKYTINVTGTNVPYGKSQPYALVISGPVDTKSFTRSTKKKFWNAEQTEMCRGEFWNYLAMSLSGGGGGAAGGSSYGAGMPRYGGVGFMGAGMYPCY